MCHLCTALLRLATGDGAVIPVFMWRRDVIVSLREVVLRGNLFGRRPRLCSRLRSMLSLLVPPLAGLHTQYKLL
jgi:hypothetical protein